MTALHSPEAISSPTQSANVLALGLAFAAFAIVYYHLGSPSTGFAVILALAFVQIIAHMRCFLHMGVRSARPGPI